MRIPPHVVNALRQHVRESPTVSRCLALCLSSPDDWVIVDLAKEEVPAGVDVIGFAAGGFAGITMKSPDAPSLPLIPLLPHLTPLEVRHP